MTLNDLERSTYCSVVSVMRVLRLESRGYRYKVALYTSAICILTLITKLKWKPFEFQASSY